MKRNSFLIKLLIATVFCLQLVIIIHAVQLYLVQQEINLIFKTQTLFFENQIQFDKDIIKLKK